MYWSCCYHDQQLRVVEQIQTLDLLLRSLLWGRAGADWLIWRSNSDWEKAAVQKSQIGCCRWKLIGRCLDRNNNLNKSNIKKMISTHAWRKMDMKRPCWTHIDHENNLGRLASHLEFGSTQFFFSWILTRLKYLSLDFNFKINARL